jgi:hypothetical protein
LGIVSSVNISKRIPRGAPYTSVDLNLQVAADFQGSGILKGLNVVPVSATEVKIYPGAFMTPRGVAVELLNPYTLTINALAVDPIVLYAHTADEEATSDVTIDITTPGSLPNQAVVLAERTSSGRWHRRASMSPRALLGQVHGGFSSYLSVLPTTQTYTFPIDRLSFEEGDPLSVMVFGTNTADPGARWFKNGGTTQPRYTIDGRRNITVISDAAWPASASAEAMVSRDIVFQSEQLADGAKVQYDFPTGKTIVPDSNEILVFVDGILQRQSTYTEAAGSVTLDTIYALGQEVALLHMEPVFFREEFTASAAQEDFRLTLNSFQSGTRAVMVFLDGRKLNFSVDYRELDGETISLTDPDGDPTIALAGGEILEMIGIRVGVLRSDVDAIDAQAAPPQIGSTGLIGTFTGRFARERHTHQESFPLAGPGDLPVALADVASAGDSGIAAQSNHEHPTIATTSQTTRTVPIDVLELARPLPQDTEALPSDQQSANLPIITTPKHHLDTYDGLLFLGSPDIVEDADPDQAVNLKHNSGFRIKLILPLDYVGGDVEVHLKYYLTDDVNSGGGGGHGTARFSAFAEADGTTVLSAGALRFTPNASLAPGVLALSSSGSEFVVSGGLVLSETALDPGDEIFLDLMRVARDVSVDTMEAGIVVTMAILQYTG